ncbi:hypothetical protein R3I93_010646 [Phoxinus phoxinus]|uniref:non-specific serine/threonine protein kinase n=1 Tax=Phoxinus phoxinus TaxID=58324 RepID=A0AAN9CW45_9TELE
MAHMMGERGGRSRSRRAAFSQTAGQEFWRPGSDDQDPLPDPSQDLPGYLTSLSSEFSVSTGQAHGTRVKQRPEDGRQAHGTRVKQRPDDGRQAHGTRVKQRPDDGRPSTSSKHSRRGKAPECRKRKRAGCLLRLWKATKGVFSGCSCSAVTVVEPFVPPADPDPEPSSPAPDHSGVQTNNGRSRSWRTSSTDSSPGITSSSARSLSEAHVERRCGESWSLSSRGSYSVEWRWSGDGSESSNQQGLSGSDSLEVFPCPPLPGQVPVEPTETSTGRTAQGAVEASPVNKSSTEFFESFYNVEKIIGSGAFGRVFLGTCKFDGKKVAIKQIRKIDNDRYLYIPGNPEPLVTEVALLMMMMRREPISPFVIQLYEWFEHPRDFTLVMEYPGPCKSLLDCINGQPLFEWLSRVIMHQAVLAVQHCIRRGVFHNDIHAQNFLLKIDTLDLKLIDFGCGQLFSREGYESNIYRGAAPYCPPEVWTGARFHAVPANVWSLGVLLYEMSNACLPFCNRTEVTQAKVTFQNPNLSKDCRDLIRQCLARDPTKRPSLEQMLQHQWFDRDQQ